MTTPEYIGTLAAARCLGAHGVRVVVASSSMLDPARWSRAVSRVVRSPRIVEPEAVLAWLLRFGEREPGAVLHPTSDEMAWVIARHEAALARVFRLYTAPFDAVRSLLDKAELHRAARDAGLAVPKTFFPRDEDEASSFASEHDALVLKPRTQAFYAPHFKGRIVRGGEAAREAWRLYRRWLHAESVRSDAPDIDKPLLQEVVPNDGVYSIAGFITRDGTVFAMRASRKVLQLPRDAGVGVSFEAAPLEAEVSRRLGILARNVGFFGVFEAELVGHDRRLIDFNPRYYGQMGFDVARGAPLPWLLQLAALGRESALVDAAALLVAHPPHTYEEAIAFRLNAAIQRLKGANGAVVTRPRDRATMDATFAAADPLPAFALAVSTFWSAARHPRGFWRSLRA